MDNLYEILGVARGASTAEIRRAYAQIARDRHPDRFSDPVEKERAQEFFKEATAAFNALSNERRRREYDAQIEKPVPKSPEEHARAAFAQAQELLKAGGVAAAVELLRQAVYHQPDNGEFRFWLGRALTREARTAREGIQILEDLTRADPRNAAVFFALAQALKGQGLALRARKAAEAAAALAPQDRAFAELAAELRPSEPEPPPEGGRGGFFRRKS